MTPPAGPEYDAAEAVVAEATMALERCRTYDVPVQASRVVASTLQHAKHAAAEIARLRAGAVAVAPPDPDEDEDAACGRILAATPDHVRWAVLSDVYRRTVDLSDSAMAEALERAYGEVDQRVRPWESLPDDVPAESPLSRRGYR